MQGRKAKASSSSAAAAKQGRAAQFAAPLLVALFALAAYYVRASTEPVQSPPHHPPLEITAAPSDVDYLGSQQPILHRHNGDPRVTVTTIDDFLSAAEVDALLGAPPMRDMNATASGTSPQPLFCFDRPTTLASYLKLAGRSMPGGRWNLKGTACVGEELSSVLSGVVEFSRSAAFYHGEAPFTARLERRIAATTRLRTSHGGKWQLTQYPPGVGYSAHTDCMQGNGHRFVSERDRHGTILMYLSDASSGLESGATVFPSLGVSITPKRGRALVFNSMARGACLDASIHEAVKVAAGTKIILQRWYYQAAFEGLGSRPPDAPKDLPVRREGQARVSCDADTTSRGAETACRQYDEWNYDHIYDYRRQFGSGWFPRDESQW